MEQYFPTIWKSVVLLITGILLLRIAGRKSISQMTLAQTVVMISIGAIIIQPIIETSVLRTIVAVVTFVLVLVLLEWLQVRYNFVENLVSGKAIIVIKDGQPVVENLRRMRLTVDQVEMRLRQQGIEKMTDVQTATIEHNGQLGYKLMRHAKPLTIGEFEKLVSSYLNPQPAQPTTYDIFDEVEETQRTH